jgi:glutamine amidotransferase
VSVVLVDAGGSNLGSVRAAFGRLGVDAPVTGDPARIRAATHVVLPGVGAAAVAMARLREQGLVELIRALRQPVLGVCVGMQILFEHSEEGDTDCLGVLPGRVARLPGGPGLRVPHMGWNQLQAAAKHAGHIDVSRVPSDRRALGPEAVEGSPKHQPDSHPLCAGLIGQYAYFVHSFAAPVTESSLLCVEHGQAFSALVSRGNYSGAQFHPERSAKVGARLLANFLALAR